MRPAEEPDIILERELRDAYYSTVDVNALSEALLDFNRGRTVLDDEYSVPIQREDFHQSLVEHWMELEAVLRDRVDVAFRGQIYFRRISLARFRRTVLAALVTEVERSQCIQSY